MKKLLVYLFPLILFTNISFAIIEIDITEGNREPLPLAISEFFHDNNQEIIDKKITENIRTVISDDLERSGLFSSIDDKAFIQTNRAMHLKPRFADWRLIKAQGLLTGELTIEDDRLRVEFRLWDTFAEKEIEGLVLITTIDNWRRISHMIADKIYERLTGEEGYFDTRIVYVAEEGPKNKKKTLEVTVDEMKNFSFAYIEKYAPSKQQLRTYLLKKYIKLNSLQINKRDISNLIDIVLEDLENAKFINDKFYSNSKAKSLIQRGSSINKIRNYLFLKGIRSEFINETIDQIKEKNEDQDFFSAIKLCKKRRIGPSREENNRPLFYKKDIGVLARSGFDFETSKRVLDIKKDDYLKIINLL